MNQDDRRLIEESLAGQISAFGDLVRLHQDRLYNAVLRVVDQPEDAYDVVQDAFINAFQSLNSFKGDSEFFTWLYRIAFNVAISLKRKRKALYHLDFGEDGKANNEPIDTSEYSQPGAELEKNEDHLQLHAALQKLSMEHRMVLILKDIEGQKYEDIAAALDVPIGTVRSRLHRARMELHDLITSDQKIDQSIDREEEI